jgi:hypothetical protein
VAAQLYPPMSESVQKKKKGGGGGGAHPVDWAGISCMSSFIYVVQHIGEIMERPGSG